jgi:N-methylhydantoinase A
VSAGVTRSTASWRLGVDIGGTFTDAILWNDQTGFVAVSKVLTTPDDPSRSFKAAVDRLLDENRVAGRDVGYVAHGTTIATNAVLQRRLEPTGLVATAGFRDVFEIARQVRPDPLDVFAEKPPPLVPRRLCLEVRGRLTAEGAELAPLSEEDVRSAAAVFRREGIRAIAVCLLHSYRNRTHERRVGEILRDELPDAFVSLSSDLASEFREFPRACTAAINAGLAPVVSRYLQRIEDALTGAGFAAQLRIMQSNGGVLSLDVARERPVYVLESGPSAGVMGAAHLARALDEPDVISFDMGGTTAKVGLVRGGQAQMVTQIEVGRESTHSRDWFAGANGYPVMTPAVDLVEIGAGGGSIAWIDSGNKLRVGPQSAGAAPGPACYGLGGCDPTVTDANLVLGRLNPEFFLGGEIQLSVAAAEAAIAPVAERIGRGTVDAAMGIVEIADAAMVRALRLATVQRGHDPRGFALVAYGGAGPLHAVALAAEMGIPRVIVQPRPGLASALGLLVTDVRHEYALTRLERTERADAGELEAAFAAMERQGRETLAREGVDDRAMVFERRADLRYYGQSYQLTVPADRRPIDRAAIAELVRAFNRTHETLYGYAEPSEPVEIVNVRSTAIGRLARPRATAPADPDDRTDASAVKATRPVFFAGEGFVDTRIYDRYRLRPGECLDGPAVVEERDSTVLVHPRWTARVDDAGNLVLSATRAVG